MTVNQRNKMGNKKEQISLRILLVGLFVFGGIIVMGIGLVFSIIILSFVGLGIIFLGILIEILGDIKNDTNN